MDRKVVYSVISSILNDIPYVLEEYHLTENGYTPVKGVLELIYLLGIIYFVPLKLTSYSFIGFYVAR
jgi:hypothetical protein